jgi:hypothetical protein
MYRLPYLMISMAKRNQINFKVNDRTKAGIEEFAEDYEFNQAETVREIVKDRLAAEDYIPSDRAVPDGGQLPTKADIEEVENALKDLEKGSDGTEETQSLIQFQTLLIAAGFVFIAAELSVGLPDLLVIFGGLLILAALTGFNLRRYGYV